MVVVSYAVALKVTFPPGAATVVAGWTSTAAYGATAGMVPFMTIKELAGHEWLETTQRYMHLSAAAPREGIRALERGTTRLPDDFGERNRGDYR